MKESIGDGEFSEQFIETLRELAAELSEDFSEANIADEHVRFDLYRKAVGFRDEGEGVFATLLRALSLDPDRVMVSGVAGVALTADTPGRVVDGIVRSVGDSSFVRRRVDEIQIIRELEGSDASGDLDAILQGASGWLEEELAGRSESFTVLNHLAVKAVRRRARRVASERLKKYRRAASD